MTAEGFVARFLTRRVGGMLWRNTVVSTGVFLLGLVVLWVLVEFFQVDRVIAAALSFAVSTSLHYVLGREWVFHGTERKAGRGFAIFLVNALVGLGVTVGLFWVLVAFTTINYLVARVIVSMFAGLAMFALNGVWNFRQI
ncbi:hypothetical protein GRI62_05015 [Erythrobacter arachoides]|uniref:GtrA/DPMS transmembrane domain-containing protein n=1 Tax=Aurantiacibacter arachoides TaxID=1850444 RepID=A0A844ZYJ8_9SPHN|nr:GtrA family protein [Aurantiacibacter arachoides]MXO92965.1 hypothetical protein [Aurantiacibacter arachoides]GGD53111.1 hypothetical protein GCM10011411_11200 [Aurantiacibacter arachoides]